MDLPEIPPGFLLIAGALLVPFLPGKAKNAFTVLLPAIAFYWISRLPATASLHYSFLAALPDLALLRVDGLSKAFGYIFTLNAFAAFIYAFHLKDSTQHTAALVYIGSALGVVFAGDLITLYIFWEIMALSSTFLVLARKTPGAHQAGFRYILVHIVGGLLLLAGIAFIVTETGSTAFTAFQEESFAAWLVLLGFLVNAAAPPLHAWLSDAYPESTVTGGVILSAYTTKTAVYTLIRGFPGWEILIAVGCIMTIYGIIYALLENDIRRILAYSIINQVGFMVAGVGIGTAMSLNGSVAHAFCHIIYKALLWMSAGAVLFRVGKSRCTDLGGLYKTMPWTLVLGTIGALAISSVPLTSGFTSKTLIIQAAANEHLFLAWLVLEVASAGVFLHAGIKFPYFVFFAKDKGLRPPDAPLHMKIGMGILAFLCIFLGVYPEPLYQILPFPADYEFQVYTFAHVLTQCQLLIFSALAFFLFLPLLKRTETISLDTDWFYRRGGRLFYFATDRILNGINAGIRSIFVDRIASSLAHSAERIPGKVINTIMIPYWMLLGFQGKDLDDRKKRTMAMAERGSFPIGITALLAVVGIGLLLAVAV